MLDIIAILTVLTLCVAIPPLGFGILAIYAIAVCAS